MPSPAKRLLQVLIVSISLVAVLAGCVGPRLVFQEVDLVETGNPDRPVRWEATVLNDSKRSALSCCRAGTAKARIGVRAYLTKEPQLDVGDQVDLHGMLITDGGDPNLSRPDELAPGDTITTGFNKPNLFGLKLANYPYVIFKISTDGRANKNCSRWNTVRVESTADLLEN